MRPVRTANCSGFYGDRLAAAREAKAARAEELLFDVLGGKERFAEVDVRLLRRSQVVDVPSSLL